MLRFIMLFIIGTLLTFLALNLLAVFGLNMALKTMEKNIVISQINTDIKYLNLQSPSIETGILSCKNIHTEVGSLTKYRIDEAQPPNREVIQNAWVEVVKVSKKAAQCFQDIAQGCLIIQASSCLRNSLGIYAECVEITGRHLKAEFSAQEKSMYRRIAALNKNTFGGEEPLTVASEALPILSKSMKRMQGLIPALQ